MNASNSHPLQITKKLLRIKLSGGTAGGIPDVSVCGLNIAAYISQNALVGIEQTCLRRTASSNLRTPAVARIDRGHIVICFRDRDVRFGAASEDGSSAFEVALVRSKKWE
jgi:hypothetical protein